MHFPFQQANIYRWTDKWTEANRAVQLVLLSGKLAAESVLEFVGPRCRKDWCGPSKSVCERRRVWGLAEASNV